MEGDEDGRAGQEADDGGGDGAAGDPGGGGRLGDVVQVGQDGKAAQDHHSYEDEDVQEEDELPDGQQKQPPAIVQFEYPVEGGGKVYHFTSA